MTPRAALSTLAAEVTAAMVAHYRWAMIPRSALPAPLYDRASLLAALDHVLEVTADVSIDEERGTADALRSWDGLTDPDTREAFAPWRTRLVALVSEADVATPTPGTIAADLAYAYNVGDVTEGWIRVGVEAERARAAGASKGADAAPTPNRFRAAIPNLSPWRDRQMDDALTCALVRQGATDAEAVDVFAAEAARLRADLLRAVSLNGTPIHVVFPRNDGRTRGA